MGNISRRDALVAAVSLAATQACGADVAPGSVVACDVWTSSHGDCRTPAHFKYADPSINAGYEHGPRNFCGEHVGCATSALALI